MKNRLSSPPGLVLLGQTDRELLAVLSEDGRIAMSELAPDWLVCAQHSRARAPARSAWRNPGFAVRLDPRALGYTLQAIVRVKPLPGQLHLVEEAIRRIPEFVECDKVTGDDCFVCRLFLKTIEQLDEILSKVAERAETSTAIIKSTPVERRLPPLD